MAVTFKTDSDYGYSLLPLFGVDAYLINYAKKAGVKVLQTSPGVFSIKLDGTTYATIQLKPQAISLAKSKTLGVASKTAITAQFSSGLKKAIEASGGFPPPSDPDSVVGAPTVGVMSTPPKTTAKPLKVKGVDLSPSTSTGGNTSIVGPLKDASKLYQSVQGTSPGSVYRVIGLFDGMAMAAKVSKSSFSLRVEGPQTSKYSDRLSELGMDKKNGYWSGHYEFDGIPVLRKALAAAVGTMGTNNIFAQADVNYFLTAEVQS